MSTAIYRPLHPSAALASDTVQRAAGGWVISERGVGSMTGHWFYRWSVIADTGWFIHLPMTDSYRPNRNSPACLILNAAPYVWTPDVQNPKRCSKGAHGQALSRRSVCMGQAIILGGSRGIYSLRAWRAPGVREKIFEIGGAEWHPRHWQCTV